VWAYAPETYPGRAVLYVTAENPQRGRLGALGWERLVRGGLVVTDLPGNHYSLLRPPIVEDLAKLIRAAMKPAGRMIDG
jgi:thioesterase domain-containing protein